MKENIIKTILILVLMQMILLGCENNSEAPLIGQVDDDSITILISKEKIQDGLTSFLTPSQQDFIVYSIDIVDYQNKYFLKLTGVDNQKCMIALKEHKGKLFELNDNKIPMVICTGCDEGCEPKLTEKGWYCSDGCSSCEKSVSVSDNYIFK